MLHAMTRRLVALAGGSGGAEGWTHFRVHLPIAKAGG